MNLVRKFKFCDELTNECLDVLIPEVLDPRYGMYIWPCAPVLAQYLWFNRVNIRGKTILELSAGTALPGIVAAKCDANVHLSDSAELAECRNNCSKSCSANGLQNIKVHGITWGRFDHDLFDLPALDIIIGSDCFYDTKDFEDIIVTVSFLLERNKGAEFWFTYQERSSSRSIEHLLDYWNLDSTEIPLLSFGADKPNLAGSDLPGSHTIKMFKLFLQCSDVKIKH